MLTRYAIAASLVALLSAAPTLAQDSSGGKAGQSGAETMQPNADAADAGGAGKAKGSDMKADTDTGPNADQGTLKKKKTAAEAEQDPGGDDAQAAGQDKKKAAAGSEQANEAEGDADQQGTKKQKSAGTKGEADKMTTGSTRRAEITPEKRTVIREKIITKNVTRIDRDDIDFDISVGVVVPSTIVLQPLPVEVVEVVPEYEGYHFFVLADGTIVIVAPDSMEIVTTIVI